MTKKELMSQLENAKNNYILGLAAISLFSNEKVYPILEESHAKFGVYTVEFKQVKNLLMKPADQLIAIKEFLTSQIRSLIKESFELLKNYCNETKQDSTFKAETWYQFARMIRNCLSHNFRFEFNKYDKNVLPVSWNRRTIDSTMDGKHLELNFERSSSSCMVMCDGNYIQQVLRNIVGNGIQFTEKGKVVICFEDKGDSVLISIRDTGQGIPQEDVPRIFMRFEQLHRPKQEQQGAGLGLTYCQKIIELHKGEINVVSEKDVGSTFTIQIPRKLTIS